MSDSESRGVGTLPASPVGRGSSPVGSTRVIAVGLIAALAGCGAAATQAGAGGGGGGLPRATGDRQTSIVLYQDAALVHERWRVALDGGRGTVEVPVDAGLEIEDLSVIGVDGARLVSLALRRPEPQSGDPVTAAGAEGTLIVQEGARAAIVGADRTVHVVSTGGVLGYRGGGGGGDVRAVITLEGEGREGWVELTYPTLRLSWRAAYALIQDVGGATASLEGAVAVHNRTGLAFPRAAVRVVDQTSAGARKRAAADLGLATLGVGTAAGKDGKGGKDAKDPAGGTRDLGVVDLGRGQTRMPLAIADRLPLREILVFDAVGTKYDTSGVTPVRTRDYGLDATDEPAVLRSFQIEIDQATRARLPPGQVRLFGRGAGGELIPLGAGLIFQAASSSAKSATVPVGRSPDVTGERARTAFTLDEVGIADGKGGRSNRRLDEEFTITLTNAGDRAVQVLVREHLYRGKTWSLGYASAIEREKEGDQQFFMKVEVPAKGETRVVYRVVYPW
jgi:hypothetical protein